MIWAKGREMATTEGYTLHEDEIFQHLYYIMKDKDVIEKFCMVGPNLKSEREMAIAKFNEIMNKQEAVTSCILVNLILKIFILGLPKIVLSNSCYTNIV